MWTLEGGIWGRWWYGGKRDSASARLFMLAGLRLTTTADFVNTGLLVEIGTYVPKFRLQSILGSSRV